MLLSSKKSGLRAATSLLLCLVLLFAQLKTVTAAINSCDASVTPATVQPNSQSVYTFSIKNNGPSNVVWIQIERPSTNFSITNAVWSGSTSVSDAQVTLYDGNVIQDGGTGSVEISVHAGENQTSGEQWTVRVSENSDGSAAVQCTGTLNASVSGTRVADPDTTAPVIDQVKVSKLRTTSVVVAWVTDEPSTSRVSYGETTDYGKEVQSDALVTNHSLTLDRLTSDTGYHYYVTSYDASGNGSSSDDNTFLTPVSNSADAAQPVVIPGISSVPLKAVPTEKVPPKVNLMVDSVKTYKVAPTINGTAEDNDILAGVYYSTDGGKNWQPVERVTGLGTNRVVFSFTPTYLQDGNYDVKVYAIDASANKGFSDNWKLIIDRLPPNIGGIVITSGSQTLLPDPKNVLSSMVGIDQTITLNAVGGPVNITVSSSKVNKAEEPQFYTLSKSSESNIWKGIMSFSEPGTYKLHVASVDGAGNETTRELHDVQVFEAGKITSVDGSILKQAKIEVYTLATDSNSWETWDAETYGQSNPVKISKKGNYGLLLPAGTYYMKISNGGYRSAITQKFVLKSPSIINRSYSLKESFDINVGNLHISTAFPKLVNTPTIQLDNKTISVVNVSIGKPLPSFTLPNTNGTTLKNTDLYGKPSIVTFLNTWSDESSSQLLVLRDVTGIHVNVVVVGSGESLSKLKSYTSSANSTLPIVADSDSKLAQDIGLANVPTSYFIDRHGVVKKVMFGVLSKEEIFKNVSL